MPFRGPIVGKKQKIRKISKGIQDRLTGVASSMSCRRAELDVHGKRTYGHGQIPREQAYG